MSDWVLLRCEAELEMKAKALRRKCRGHYYTNYYFIRSTRDNDLRYTEMFYREDGDNLYAIERRDDFYQLFYFVGEADRIRLELPPSVEHGVLTCEIDEEEEKEKQGPVLEKLYEEGFADYKNYHIYDRKGGQDFQRSCLKDCDLTYQASVEELSAMYDIFDPYSDSLPLRKAFPEYLETMDILSCAVNGKYGGSSMVKKDGWGATYIFACSGVPGTGSNLLSARIDRDLYAYPGRIKCVSVEDHNVKSIRLHTAFGYESTKRYHKILIRRV